MMRHFRSFPGIILIAAGACAREEPPKKIVLDTATEAADQIVYCVQDRNHNRGQAFVVVHLDSAAARANRITINIVKQDSTVPVRARLQSSSGSAECVGNPAQVEFRVRGDQTYLGLTVYAGTTFLGVNARRVGDDRYRTGEMLNGRAYATDDVSDELVWGDAVPGNMDNQRGGIRQTYPDQDRTKRQPRGLPQVP